MQLLGAAPGTTPHPFPRLARDAAAGAKVPVGVELQIGEPTVEPVQRRRVCGGCGASESPGLVFQVPSVFALQAPALLH